MVICAPFSESPLIVGWLLFVIKSSFSEPVSVSEVKDQFNVGFSVSTVKLKSTGPERFPARSSEMIFT